MNARAALWALVPFVPFVPFLALAACAERPLDVVPADRPELEDAVVTLGEGPERVQITLASAWLSPDGAGGHGTDVSATVGGPPPSPGLVITGKQSAWDLKGGAVTFDGGVVAVRGDVTITCDRLDVTYVGDKVDVAVAAGHVIVTKGSREATGDVATLTVAEGRVALTGSPRIVEGPNHMTGTLITLFLDDERLLCDDCRLEVADDAVKPR